MRMSVVLVESDHIRLISTNFLQSIKCLKRPSRSFCSNIRQSMPLFILFTSQRSVLKITIFRRRWGGRDMGVGLCDPDLWPLRWYRRCFLRLGGHGRTNLSEREECNEWRCSDREGPPNVPPDFTSGFERSKSSCASVWLVPNPNHDLLGWTT